MLRGLIGKNINYSYSKTIHEYISNNEYNIINIDRLEDIFIEPYNFDFFNITIPYKKEVIKFLDYLDPISKEIGACNLVINKNGKLHGYNTDYYGFNEFLKCQNISINNKKVLILGTGGASQMLQKLCLDNHVSSIKVCSREKYEYLNDFITYDEVYKYEFDVLINATPVGTSPNFNESLIDFNKFKCSSNLIVIDLIYNPSRTKLLQDALEKGYSIYNGLDMLIYQAIYTYKFLYEEHFKSLNIEDLHEYIKGLLDKSNIVLIGMPLSGKSSFGFEYASKNQLEFYDIDTIIEEKYGPISDIFINNGEEYFRKLEHDVIKEISLKENSVIVPGGGAILDFENVINLRANGELWFIDTSLDELIKRSKNVNNRPLITNEDDIKKIYDSRIELYKKYCDKIIYLK